MISQREKGIYISFCAAQIALVLLLFGAFYLANDFVRVSWLAAPKAYGQILLVTLLALMAEAATRAPRGLNPKQKWLLLFGLLGGNRSTFMLEVVTHVRGDLPVGHLVCGFHADDVALGERFFEFLGQLPLGLAWSEDQQSFGMANVRHDLLIVAVQLRRELALAQIIRLGLERFK
jgi:hypothetical protein